jgi:hypothetical protein
MFQVQLEVKSYVFFVIISSTLRYPANPLKQCQIKMLPLRSHESAIRVEGCRAVQDF